MATHAYRTRTPIVQPGLLRAAGPCNVLTEAEVVALVGEAPPLLPAEVCSTAPQTPCQADTPTAMVPNGTTPSAEFHGHLAKPGQTVRHGGAPHGGAMAGKVADFDLGKLPAERSAELIPDQNKLPPPAPLPSLTAAFSRRRAIFGAVEIEADTERALASSDLALAQMRHARQALEGSFAIRGEVSAAAPLSDDFQTNRFTKDQRPSFADWPRWFAMRCHGTCLDPVIPDGSSCIFDKEASYQAGDYVVIWALQPGGLITPFVKRLVMGVAPWARFPHVRGDDEIVPVVMFETLNPPQTFRANASTVYGIHKCVGYAPRTADVPIGTKVVHDVEHVQWFDRPVVKKPRRARVPRRTAA